MNVYEQLKIMAMEFEEEEEIRKFINRKKFTRKWDEVDPKEVEGLDYYETSDFIKF